MPSPPPPPLEDEAITPPASTTFHAVSPGFWIATNVGVADADL